MRGGVCVSRPFSNTLQYTTMTNEIQRVFVPVDRKFVYVYTVVSEVFVQKLR